MILAGAALLFGAGALAATAAKRRAGAFELVPAPPPFIPASELVNGVRLLFKVKLPTGETQDIIAQVIGQPGDSPSGLWTALVVAGSVRGFTPGAAFEFAQNEVFAGAS